jgi:hypothetical protein
MSLTTARTPVVMVFLLVVGLAAFWAGRARAQSCSWGGPCYDLTPASCQGLWMSGQKECAMYSYWDPGSCGEEGYCCAGAVYCCAEYTLDCGSNDWSYCTSDSDCGDVHEPCPCAIMQ